MELGGLDHDRERVFLLSTTHGAEHVGLAAGIATMATYEDEPVIETLHERGEQLRAGVEEVARRRGVEEHFTVAGVDRASSSGPRTPPVHPLRRFGRCSSRRRSHAGCSLRRSSSATPTALTMSTGRSRSWTRRSRCTPMHWRPASSASSAAARCSRSTAGSTEGDGRTLRGQCEPELRRPEGSGENDTSRDPRCAAVPRWQRAAAETTSGPRQSPTRRSARPYCPT